VPKNISETRLSKLKFQWWLCNLLSTQKTIVVIIAAKLQKGPIFAKKGDLNQFFPNKKNLGEKLVIWLF